MIWQVYCKNIGYLDIKKVSKKVSKMVMNQKLVQHLSSVENVHRKNSIAIDMSTIYGRENMPNRMDMFKFVHMKLGLKAEELVDIQDHPFLPQVFVKVKSETVLVRVENKIKAGVRMDSKNITLYGWRCDIPLTTVKLNGANPDTTRDRVVDVMSKYGKVESCDRGRVDYFKNSFVSDGTWILRIRTEQGKGLPSTLYYSDEGGHTDIWSVIFDGKVAACFKCGAEGHRGDHCRAAKPKPAEQGLVEPVGVGTYCDVVKAGVNIKWQGMTNQGADLNKQLSLKAKPVKKVFVNQLVKKGVEFQHYDNPEVRRMSSCMRNRLGLDNWSGLKVENMFAGLENEEEEVEEIQVDEIDDISGKPKRPRVNSKTENVREVKSKLNNNEDDDFVGDVVTNVDENIEKPEPVVKVPAVVKEKVDISGGNVESESESVNLLVKLTNSVGATQSDLENHPLGGNGGDRGINSEGETDDEEMENKKNETGEKISFQRALEIRAQL